MPTARPLVPAALAAALALTGCAAPGTTPGAVVTPPADAVRGGAGIVAAGGGNVVGNGAAGVAAPSGASGAGITDSPAAQLGRSLDEGLADERDLADYGYLFDDGSGIVAAGGGNLVGADGASIVAAGGGNYGLAQAAADADLDAAVDLEADAPVLTPALGALADAGLRTRLREGRKKLAAAARERLAARADRKPFLDAVAKAEVKADPGKGTKTYRFTARVPWNGFTRQVLFVYTVDAATNMLVHGYSAVLRPRLGRPNKPFHQIRREFALTEDGGFRVSYVQASTLLKRGLRRVVRFEQTTAADGTVTGQGRIAWWKLTDLLGKPVRKVPIALGGSEADETFEVVEGDASVKIERPIGGLARATPKAAATAAAEPIDLGLVEPEAEPEDPTQPATL
jgi:hypothetical protein